MSELNAYTAEELEAELLRREVEKRQGMKPHLIENPNLNDLIGTCQNYVNFVDSDDYYDDNDYRQYIYEEAMKAFFGRDFFEWKNNRHNF